MHRPVPSLLLALGLALGSSGCWGISTRTRYDRTFDFTRIHTYDWIGIRGAPSDFVADRIVAATDRELGARGFEKVDSDPDFRIVVYFDVSAGTSVRGPIADGAGGTAEDLPPSWTGGSGGTDVQSFREGSMRVDFVTAGDRDLIWQGFATGAFSPRMRDAARAEAVNEAIGELLARFPPR